jgi:hypothetical protein
MTGFIDKSTKPKQVQVSSQRANMSKEVLKGPNPL